MIRDLFQLISDYPVISVVIGFFILECLKLIFQDLKND